MIEHNPNWTIQKGDVFMRLTTLEGGPRKAKIKCVCVCGAEREVFGENLISGNTQSCGCLKKDRTKVRREA